MAEATGGWAGRQLTMRCGFTWTVRSDAVYVQRVNQLRERIEHPSAGRHLRAGEPPAMHISRLSDASIISKARGGTPDAIA